MIRVVMVAARVADQWERMQTPGGWVSLPENEAASCAAEQVAGRLCGAPAGGRGVVNPLFVHGPAGSGKSFLVGRLVARVSREAPGLQMAVLAADGLGQESSEDLRAARQADLLVVEDLQHLPARAAEGFAALVDRCRASRRQLVCTSLAGPAGLTHLPSRLTSRLAQGLVVGLEPLAPASRRTFLRERANQRSLRLGEETLDWLAEHVPGSLRQLEGALTRLAALAALAGRVPDREEVEAHFREDAEARRPTMERIAQRVGRYFQVEPGQIRSRRRSRDALLPRQVSMYLARRLTGLSLGKIGEFFGGRDHSTVLHACRKVEQALARDVALSGAVRRLHADLA
jgi:chromosomal replication initiator protein